MKADELVNFFTTEKPKYTYKQLKVFPNSSIADLFFQEEIAANNNLNIDLSVNYTSRIVSYKGKQVMFVSVDKLDSIKNLCFNDVYVHPSIKEIHL